MKRSEMIKLMELEDIARCRYVGFNSHYERMESLLNCIENAGMLPPTVFKEKFIDCGNGQGFTTYEQNEWDPEND